MKLFVLDNHARPRQSAVLPALSHPVSWRAIKEKKPLLSNQRVSLRGAGVILDRSLGKMVIERDGEGKVFYAPPHVVLFLAEPGTITRFKVGSGEGATLSVSPSGKWVWLPGYKAKVVHAPEKAVPGAAPEVQEVLNWEFYGMVCLASTYMARSLVGLETDRYAFPADAAGFERCHRIFEQLPYLRERLPSLASKGREWSALVEQWESISAVLKEEREAGVGRRVDALVKNVVSGEKP